MMTKLIGLWRSHQRAVDLRILWPECKALTSTLDDARAVFAVHAFNDNAWTCLGDDEITKRIGELS